MDVGTTGSVDEAITAEIIRNALIVAADEASVVVVRSSHSTWIQEGADAAAAILDATGRLVTQSAATSLMHAASLRCGLLCLLEEIPTDQMLPGDVYAVNDPYRGGIHANDILVLRPVFADARVAYFAATVIHVADVGGSNAGGVASLATDTFAEGILLPAVRLYRAGEPQDDVFKILSANSRMPGRTRGDVNALIAGVTTIARHLDDLLARYGSGELAAHVDAFIDYSERRVREGLRAFGTGTHEGGFTIDTDGIDPDREFEVRVRVSFSDGRVAVDFTGTSPQASGPINASWSQALSGVVYAIRSLVDPSIPLNEGSFRIIDATFPQGSLLNPDPPAACGGRVVSVTAAIDAILDALSTAHPERAVAPSSLIQIYALSGRGGAGEESWVTMGYEFGGIGARRGMDGPDATGSFFLGGRSVIPQIEPVEARLPLIVESLQLATDSGGPGRWRGGLGVEMCIRMLQDAELTVRGDRIIGPPPGRQGGLPGRPGAFTVRRAHGEHLEELAPRQSHVRLAAGDVFVLRTSGGGGLGSPDERDPAAVLADLREGRVSPEGAERDYGFREDATTGAADPARPSAGAGR